jgi:hypothetical protein
MRQAQRLAVTSSFPSIWVDFVKALSWLIEATYAPLSKGLMVTICDQFQRALESEDFHLH